MTTAFAEAQILRQTDLGSIAAVLNEQRARAIDVILPARQISLTGSIFELTGLELALTPDGFMDPNGLYTPTSIAVGHIAKKLDIDLRYLRRCQAKKPQLFQDNVLGWLEDDDSQIMLRLLRSDDSPTGLLRAVLSNKYLRVDNIDVLMAALAGIQQAGIQDPIIDADLTESRMVVRVTVPEMAVYADKLLENYRSPFDGTDISMGWTPDRLRQVAEREGQAIDGGGKLVFAGIVISNSEVGAGRFKITPRIEVQACGNGLTFVAEGLKKTHLGAELDEGTLDWSEDTQRANLTLITNQTTDVVKKYLNTEYVAKKVAQLEKVAGEPVREPVEVIAAVSKKFAFTQDQQNLILGHFIRGGQQTVGGVMQAVTSAAQVVRNGDTAFDMEHVAVDAMHFAHTVNKQLAAAK